MYSRISRKKNQKKIIDHYLKGICNITQQYGMYTIEIKSTSNFHGRYLLQTDDLDIEFSKVLTEYKKKHTTSKLTKSEFTIH